MAHARQHTLDSATEHAVSGLTAGHVLRAATATTFAFAAIGAGDLPSAIDAANIANGTISNTEFQYLNGVTGAIQGQIDAKMPLAGGTFVGDVTFSGTYKAIFGDAGQYIRESAPGVLSYVAGTRHQFEGKPVYIGTGSPGHTITGAGDLFVADRLEVDGQVNFDSAAYFRQIAYFLGAFKWQTGGLTYLDARLYADDGIHWGIGEVDGGCNYNMIFTARPNVAKDHDHDTLSAHPTLFWQSATDPNTANDEWLSISFPVTHALLAVGSGWLEIATDILSPNNAKHYFDDGANKGTEYITSNANTFLDIVANAGIRLTTTGVVTLTAPANGVLSVAGDVWVFSNGGNPRLVLGDTSSAGDYGSIRWVSASDSIGIGTDTGGVDTLLISEAGNVLLAGTGQFQLGDSGTYLYQSANSVLSYVADGRHEFTGKVYVGSGTPGHINAATGNLYVADRFEVDGAAYFDDQTYFYGLMDCRNQDIMHFFGATFGGLYRVADDGLHFYVYAGAGSAQNRNLIICDYAARADDYDHSALSANPHLFVHSLTRSASETDEWISFSHNVTNGVIALGSGMFYIGPTANQEAAAAKWHVTTAGTEYTSSGAAGYFDVHFPDEDKGCRFYSGANLLWTLSRYSGAGAGLTKVTIPDSLFVSVGATDLFSTNTTVFRFRSGYISVFGDTRRLVFGALATGDSGEWWDGSNHIIDPDYGSAGNGWVYVGATHDDGLWAGEFKCGDATNYAGISAAGDLMFYGTGGLAFGEIWVLGNAVSTPLNQAGVFAQFVGFVADGNANDAVPDHTNDHITITTAGKYLVVASFHVESVGAGAADVMSMEIRKNNGTGTFSNLHAHRKLAGGGGDIASISISGIADLAATDTVEVWLTNDDNATDILVKDANLSVVQIGGT